MIFARRFAERHLGGGFGPPLGQHIATVDLDCLANVMGFLPCFYKWKQLGASEANIMAFAAALEPEKPRGSSPLIDLQKQPVTVLIGPRMSQCRLDRQSCELFHRYNPIFFPHTCFRGRKIFPHIFPTLFSVLQ